MNQLKKYFTIMMIIFAFTPLQTQARAKEAMTSNAIASQKIIFRLNEINAMDKSHLTLSEKKDIRNEILKMREQTAPGGGVYISAGALIVIVIILLILL